MDQMSAAQTYINITRLVWSDNCVSVLLPIAEPVAVQVMCWKVLLMHVRPHTSAQRHTGPLCCHPFNEVPPVYSLKKNPVPHVVYVWL